MPSTKPKHLLSQLSPQQLEVLKRVCQGYRYQAIADELYISLSTVKSHMAAVYNKLELTHLIRDERMYQIRSVYCPLLQELEETPQHEQPVPKSEPEIVSAPITPEVEEIIMSDETAIIAFRDAPPIPIPTPSKEKRKLRGRGCLRFGVVLFILAILIVGGFFAWQFFQSGSIPQIFPSSAYEIGEWHKEGDLWIRLVDYKIDTYDRTEVYFYIEMWNQSNQDVLFSWMPAQNLTLKDNTGKRYDLDNFSVRSKPEDEILTAQSRMMLETFPSSYTAGYKADQLFSQNVTELILTIEYLSMIDKVTFRIPINK